MVRINRKVFNLATEFLSYFVYFVVGTLSFHGRLLFGVPAGHFRGD